MQENTNKAIIINAMLLYVRLGVTAFCGLFITRFALQALGVNDFGLYAVVGSIITFISIINTMMLSTSNRFIATAIGKGDDREINEVFNVNLVIHIVCAFLVLLIGFTIGDWYVNKFVNFDGDIRLAVKVFNISLSAAALSFIGVPFNGLLMAKERFMVFCLSDILIYPIKLALCYGLFFLDSDRLLAYSIISAICVIVPSIIYVVYSFRHFCPIVEFLMVRDWNRYKDVFSFSIWVGYGAIVQVGKSQGAAVLVNAFFNTIMNTALGIANQLHSFILMFVQNISKPIAPQITKSYAKGDLARCYSLMVITSKLSYMFMYLISFPLLLCPEFLLSLWLGTVPPYSVLFIRLIIINSLVDSFNLGIAEYVFASGRIKKYQLVTNTVLFISVIVGFVLLKSGLPAYSLLISYIVFSIIAVVVRQLILKYDHGFSNIVLIKGSYLPSLSVTAMSLIIFVIPKFTNDVVSILLSEILLCIIIICVGFTKKERQYCYYLIKDKIRQS